MRDEQETIRARADQEPLDLAAIQARADAATAGPWRTGARWDSEWVPMKPPVGGVITPASNFYAVSAPDYNYADAEFIAHAREDVPNLLTRITELEDRIARAIAHEEHQIDNDLYDDGEWSAASDITDILKGHL